MLRKLGPMGLAMLKKLPAFRGAPADLLTKERLAGLEAALTAMTPAERESAKISGARLQAVAEESGMAADQLAGMLDMLRGMRAQGGG